MICGSSEKSGLLRMPFSQEIINWYHRHKRDLPWRATKDPYVIWLSEVILQQTRVDQGLPYFERFRERFPTVKDFAEASEDEILRLWQGLGYYSRARNMHHAAKTVMKEHGGQFPTQYNSLIRLKGIGEYTAAAIASFAGGEPHAVVDGNVFRVLARYFGNDSAINSGKGKREFQELANEMLDRDYPGTYNQAIMEFGSLQCKPVRPDCAQCVLRPGCYAANRGEVERLPVKIKSRPSRNRYFHYLLVHDGDQILMNKRGPGDIWENLYELPLIETSHAITTIGTPKVGEELRRQIIGHFGEKAEVKAISEPVRHVLSHQNIHAHFYLVERVEHLFVKKTGWNFFNTKDLNKLAKPKLIFAFLDKYLNETAKKRVERCQV